MLNLWSKGSGASDIRCALSTKTTVVWRVR
eukprot:COSAG02_NODE_28271_length_592_cov_1.505071_2_plen_29_part_01